MDKDTGEIITLREPDAAIHFEGDGEAAWGTKFVMVAARGTHEGTRVILDIERLEKPGAEASVTMDCFRAPRRKDGRRVAKTYTSRTRSWRTPMAVVSPCRSTHRMARCFHTHRICDKSGAYRWYNDCGLPQHLGGGIVTVRLHANEDDRIKRFNRTENVRPIPPSDPDFARLYARRNNAESINRSLEDTLFPSAA